jgi:hypothetical protein
MPAPNGQIIDSASRPDAPDVTVIATSPADQFVGAAGDATHLFVGMLNGTVVRMNPLTGRITGTVSLPDGNSAAHLLLYNGSLYVGTEWLQGAKNKAPFHVYRIDPNSMGVVGQLSMNSYFANGFIMAFGGFLWAGDGHCTLYKIEPNSLEVKGTLAHIAEDEMLFDGKNYWAECMHEVHVLQPGKDLPVEVAYGSLTLPNRPRGFFTIGTSIYTSGSLDSTLYSMSLSGSSVVFRSASYHQLHRLVTRDTFAFERYFYAYETGPGANPGGIPARVLVFDRDFRIILAISVPGPALPSDASQHTLFLVQGRVYFVTQSSIGYFAPLEYETFPPPGMF